jgi:hypothetical protein
MTVLASPPRSVRRSGLLHRTCSSSVEPVSVLGVDGYPYGFNITIGRQTARLVRLRDACPKGDAAFFADLDPPQTFALRADEILGNERQKVWRSGRALQA